VRGSEGEPFLTRLRALYSAGGQVQKTAEWSLKAVIVPALRLNPPALRFGVRSDRQLEVPQIVRIEANDTIGAIDCQAPPGWTAEITSGQAESHPADFLAKVKRKPDGNFGLISGVIRFCPVDREGKRLPPKEAGLIGEIVRDVVANPREIHHGRRPCGMTANETVRLVSPSNRPFLVKSATSRSSDLQVTRVQEYDKGWLYTLQLRFTGLGEQEASAEFTVQDEDGEEFKLVVPARYYGLQGP
jgi:hypothetical protein